jgi:filamentous hemagglutinin family protein
VLLGAVLAQGAASAAYAADALPTGGHFTAGTGSIAGDGSALAVSQSSNTGIIDWNSFSIGSGRSVVIDNGSGATLNRVTGSDLSRIDGLFSATGSAYLINHNGIVVGPGGQVITGGSFVGSTRDISNEDFLNGGAGRFSGTSSGDVVNQGTIRAEGGDAVLIGHNVSNSGSIDAPEGAAAMAAGNDVILQPVGGDRRIYIQGSAGDGNVTNDGAVTAAQAELAAAGGNVYALAGNTDGVIRATGSSPPVGISRWPASSPPPMRMVRAARYRCAAPILTCRAASMPRRQSRAGTAAMCPSSQRARPISPARSRRKAERVRRAVRSKRRANT